MTTSERYQAGLCLEPLDVLFFRDGRPFDIGSQALSGLPTPQVVAGALTTWLLRQAGCDFQRLGETMRGGATFAKAASDGQPPDVAQVASLTFSGPWLAYKGPNGVEPLVPAPANLVSLENERIVRLAPLREELPGWIPPLEDMRPLWFKNVKQTRRLKECYLTLSGLQHFLAGGDPQEQELVPARDLYNLDRRVGIAVDPHNLVAAESMIYSVRFLALKPGVCFYAEVLGARDILERLLPRQGGPSVTIPFGGEGRRVAVRRVASVRWPEASPKPGQGTLLLLTTPGLFGDQPQYNWVPRALRNSVVAAAVPGYISVSGWDLARNGPKPNRFAVQAGSVYFLKPGSEIPSSLCDGEEERTGWGNFVKGVWSYA